MGSDYYRDQDSLVNIKRALARKGWSIYGFHEDNSDSSTDYFDPAYWKGIAAKNGYILVIDNNIGGKIGGDFIERSYDFKINQRIEKLQTLADCPSASEGEKTNALEMIKKLKGKVVTEKLVEGELPEVTYQANPGRCKWHIEKNGDIIEKGTGVFKYSSLNLWRDEKIVFEDFQRNLFEDWMYKEEDWPERYKSFQVENFETEKLLDKFFQLIEKWDNLASIKLGEGDEDKLEKKVVQEAFEYYVAELSDTPTEYLKVGKKWRHYHGLHKGNIYKLSDVDGLKYIKKLTCKGLHNGVSHFSKEPRKSTKGTRLIFKQEDFENKDILYVKLVKKVEMKSKTVFVRPKKASKTYKKSQSKENTTSKSKVSTPRTNSKNEFDPVLKENFERVLREAIIETVFNPNSGEELRVKKLNETIGKKEFKTFCIYLAVNKVGYYSKLHKGVVLKSA
ncbi:MAG: hypothetical protein ACPGUI_00455 [Halarcobacter sp.]